MQDTAHGPFVAALDLRLHAAVGANHMCTADAVVTIAVMRPPVADSCVVSIVQGRRAQEQGPGTDTPAPPSLARRGTTRNGDQLQARRRLRAVAGRSGRRHQLPVRPAPSRSASHHPPPACSTSRCRSTPRIGTPDSAGPIPALVGHIGRVQLVSVAAVSLPCSRGHYEHRERRFLQACGIGRGDSDSHE